ncbi:MAG TPA: ABC transporter permease [Saprospiraceae bacterium]|nr:ABC transporter permease [Saprospiraceae bacterium]HNT20462.1 ABC transporter permease [Saprospiraceae bacterium]
MYKNYLFSAWRNLIKNKAFSFINISGLALGLSVCLLLMLFIRSEFSYDRFHAKSERIYRAWLHEVYEGQTFTNTQTPIPLGPVLKENLPDIEAFCRVYQFNSLLEQQGNRFNESVNMVDTSFFRVFDFHLMEGDPGQAFPNSNSMVISERMEEKYFGSGKGMGKTLEMQLGQTKVLFTVSAISRESPLESSIRFDFLIPHSNEHHLFSERARTQGWTNVFEETYLLLGEGKSGDAVEAQIPALVKRISGDQYVEGEYNVYLQPITDIHLNNKLPAGNAPVSDPMYSYVLGFLGILILLIACINFITLSLGRSSTRALEVGVRKVLGAARTQLIRQFWGEALMFTFIALGIAIGLSYLLLGPFNQLANRQLTLHLDGFTVMFLLALVVLVGLVSGIYPAMVLSSFLPVKVLKNRMPEGFRIGLFRKSLVTGQFFSAIVLMAGTLVMWQQFRFIRHTSLGYEKEYLVVVPTNKSRAEGMALAERFKIKLKSNPQVVGSTVNLFSFAQPGWMNIGYEDDQGIYRNFRMNAIDADFIGTMGVELAAGRGFSSDNPADLAGSMLVNERLVEEYGWDDPIGKKLPGRFNQQIIGVVKDFHFESLHSPIKPLVLVLQPDSILRAANDVGFTFSPQPRINVRLKAGSVREQIEGLKQNWQEVAGGQEFEYSFLDEALTDMYKNEQRVSSMVSWASLLSIFIASLGLFGLITLAVNRRIKEIGIRKVLGADVKGIVFLLSKDFTGLLLFAMLFAAPVGWWALDQWLQSFAYRIRLQPWVFLLAGVSVFAIAWITMSIQAMRAAKTNPVKSLRTE